MKFSCAVDIDLPMSKVIELWDNEENLKHWQDGLVSYEHLSGEPGTKGAKAKMIYESGKRRIELTETIVVKNLPEEFTGTYVAKEMTNRMTNRFVSLGDHQTRWEADLEYTQMNGFMVKLMAFLMPGMFKKQTQKWLNQFKAFAEKEG